MGKNHEGAVIAQTQIEACQRGWRLFRNSTGAAWAGRKAGTLNGNAVIIAEPRLIHYGLAVGSSDLIGWRPVVITPDMVGQTIAQFVAVECKTAGYKRTTEAQDNFLIQVAVSGGAAFIARGDGDAVKMEMV